MKLERINQAGRLLGLLLFTFVMLFLPVLLMELKVLSYTNGTFIYPFDDTFIHLKIADTVLKGNWGIHENEFASASSSILYTLILSLSRFFSNSVLVPFVVNCVAGTASLFALHFWLKREQINYISQGLIIALAIFFTPLALLVVSGMEHTFQCLFAFLFMFYFCSWLEENKDKKARLPLHILFFAVLASMIRYESLFMIAIACFLLLIYRKILGAFLLGFIALLPLVIFGLISLKNGNYFLPNSVLIKSESFSYGGPIQFLYNIFFRKFFYADNGMAALATQRLTIAIPLLYFLFRRYLKPSYFFILVILFGATIFQLAFASTGYLYRYEAYLFFCFMIITPVLFYKYGRLILNDINSVSSKIIALALIFFLFFPVVLRSTTALDKTVQGCINIYDQQYQMAAFARQYYNGGAVALNDIGAVSYFTNASIVDIWGLASMEVAKSKKSRYWTPAFLDSLCKEKDVQFAIVYDVWFNDSLPSRWKKVATWQIQNNVICGDDEVSFYSLNEPKTLLQQNLHKFQRQLPRSVVVTYY